MAGARFGRPSGVGHTVARDGDRQGRAADDGARAARPVRLCAARGDGGGGGGERARGAVSRRRVLGVVVDVADSSELPPERLAEPIEALEAGVPAEARGPRPVGAREYCSTPARGLGLVLPPGTRRRAAGAAPTRDVGGGDRRRARGASRTRLGLDSAPCSSARGARNGSDGSGVAASELAAACGADRGTLKRLEARGLVRLNEVEVGRRPASGAVGEPARSVSLTPEQDSAVGEIVAAIDSGDGAPSCCSTVSPARERPRST